MSFGKDANEFVRAYLTGQQMVNENQRLNNAERRADLAEKRADFAEERDRERLDIAHQTADSDQAYKTSLSKLYNTKAAANGSIGGPQFTQYVGGALKQFSPNTSPTDAIPQNNQPSFTPPVSAVPVNPSLMDKDGQTFSTVNPSVIDEDTSAFAHGGSVSKGYPLHHIVGEAMQHIQNRFALHAATGGAIPDRAQQAQLAAFHGNQGAIAPEAMDALRQRHGSNEKSIEGIYSHYANQGNPDAAKEAASGVMQAARARSMDFGKNALASLDKRDYQSAAKSLIDAYNEVPDDHTFTGEVNPEGVGRAVIVNNKTGKPVQQLELNPQIIAQSAQNFATGQGFYPHMVQAINPQPSQPVEQAFTGGMMGQGVRSALEDNIDTADASSDELPTPELAGQNTPQAAIGPTTAPAAQSNVPFIPPQPWMTKSELSALRMINQNLAQNSNVAASDRRVQARADAGVEAHTQNKYHDTPQYQLEYASSEAEKKYSNPKDPVQKQRLNEELTDLGVRYYDATHPKQRQAAFKMNADDPESATQYERHIAPFTTELDKIEAFAEKTNVKRADGSAMVDPKKPGVVKLDDTQRQEFLDIVNNVHSYTGKSPRQLVRALHQLAYNPLVKPEFNRRTGEWRVGDITLPLESGDLVHLRKLNNGVRQRYHMEQRANAAKAALAPEVEAQRQKFWQTTGKNSIRNDDGRAAGIAPAGGAALPNFGELPGFDPEARLRVR